MPNDYLDYYSTIRLEFSNEELKEIKNRTHKMLDNGRIIKVEKNHFGIYFALLILGFILVMPYIFISTSYQVAENILSTAMSLGAGIIGAVILAYLIEMSNEIKADKEKINNYNTSIQNIHLTLWQVFMCRPLSDFKENSSDIKPFIDQMAELTISYYEMAIRQIDIHIKQFDNLMNEEACDDLFTVKGQLINFISSIKNPINSNLLPMTLDGTKKWLRDHCPQKWLKDQWLIY